MTYAFYGDVRTGVVKVETYMEADNLTHLDMGNYPEDHPLYSQTADQFDRAFQSLVPGFDSDELMYKEWLACDWLCAVEQIMFDLHGVGDSKMLAEWNEERHHESQHPYMDAIIQAQQTATDLLRRLIEHSVPPRFRATVSAGTFSVASTYTLNETHLLQQRQMDDLVHLSKLGRSFSVHPKYEGMFEASGKLNMTKARMFVAEKAWSLADKAIHLLKLSEFEQLQCQAIASKKINNKWRNSITHAEKVKAKLNAIAEKEEQFRQYVEDFTLLSQAAYLCNGWDAKTLPQVYCWLTGKKSISRQAIQAKLVRLEKRLA